MSETPTSVSFQYLPYHLILEVLISNRLDAIDLVNIELTSKVFGWGSYSSEFKSLADHAASRLCSMHPIYMSLSLNNQKSLVTKCNGNWKRVLRFLQTIVKNSKDNMQMTERRRKKGSQRTIVTNNRHVEYTCDSSMFGDLAQWPEASGHCRELERNARLKDLSFPRQVIQVSASENNAAFVIESGEVFTCGNNYFFGCGHLETDLPISSPKLVEALDTIPCKQVATGIYSTVFLTREGHVYTVGGNAHGQLGYGDTMNRQEPTIVEMLKNFGPVVQISAGPQYVLAVTEDGSVYSFGDGFHYCLGHGDRLDKLQPHAIEAFKSKGVHILRVVAGERHVVACDSNGDVYTWGRGGGALGHGVMEDKPIPEVVLSLKNHLAVQVCVRNKNTFVEVEGGLVYAFGFDFGSVPRNNLLQHPTIHESLTDSYRSLLSQCSNSRRRRNRR